MTSRCYNPEGFDAHPPADVLLRRLYVDVDAYRMDLHHQRFARMSRQERLSKYNSIIIPIHVPLARGETVDEYEKRFARWLYEAERLSIDDVQHKPQMERYMRIRFANWVANQTYTPHTSHSPSRSREARRSEDKRTAISPEKKRQRTYEDDKKKPWRETPPARKDEAKPAERRSETSSQDTASDLVFPSRCTVQLPSSTASLDAFTTAYVACGCRRCFSQCVTRMGTHITQLEMPKLDVSCVSPSHSRNSSSPRHSPTEGKRGRFLDLTSDGNHVLKRLRRLEPHEITRKSSSSDMASSESYDHIEKQLLGEYDQLNDRVLANERVLELSIKRQQDTPVDDIKQTSAQLDAIQELQTLIQRERDNRSAALAMVIVYLWRKELEQLEEHLKSPNATNVPQVASASHQQCADIAAELIIKQDAAAASKKKLGERLKHRSSGSKEAFAHDAKELGEQLVSVQREISALITARREEFVVLIQFDEHVRNLIRTILSSSTQ
ncbi:hypothetical protein Poli38472_005916 [Pythium oligandrum]|uniref:Uncharacterized protein n=1 Tax=Pythium oligandrum TaxID=41045 RepID=A0A8K1CT50_PYTOL|nr:hypothetical protein Poli38472_005916 [Pythium oligandrum]|eukprot:TMW68448.1 hypothetical protein Poli38472_005916 [Pythium oligandrum]